jgi:hypothetical protein
MKGVLLVHTQTLGPRTPEEPMERCPRNGKRRFETKAKAEAWWNHAVASNSFGHDYVDGEIYQCREKNCGGWHVTRGLS